ncbi:MAG: hypothetical protein IJT30_11715 [Muribaculaceae bacterium]|nr:hypothetical protein [Muribaculaceae bacterium]
MTNSPTLDLRRQLRAMRRGWPLYLLSLAVMLGLATYYAVNKQDQYKIKGLVLIEDDKESLPGSHMTGGMAQMMRSFSLGGFSSDVDNEWLVMASHDVHERAVRALGLTRTYVERTGWLTKRLMYRDSPVLIDAPEAFFDSLPHSWKVTVSLHDGKADITSAKGRFASNYWSTRDATLPCTVKTPFGNLQLLKSEHYNPAANINMVINLASTNEMASWLAKLVSIEVANKKGDAIMLTVKDDRERGIDIINALIAAYNRKRADRRNDKAQAEVDFVNQRLAALQQELDESEGRVTRFKQQARVSNPTVEAQGWLRQSTQAQAEAAQAQTELTVYEMILGILQGSDGDAMLPAFEGVKDAAVNRYNDLVARRSTLAQSATIGNAALEALDKQIKPLRESIIKRAESNIAAARVKLQSIYGQATQAQGNYSRMPAAEQQYFDLLRDRELKNDLYVFLLEKRESSLLKLGSNVTPSFTLDSAYSAVKPDSTKTMIVFAIALLMALLAPTLLLLWWQHRRDWVEQPCDLPSEWEARTVGIADDGDWTRLLAKATATTGGSVLLVGDTTGTTASMIGEQMKKLGINTTHESMECLADVQRLPAGAAQVVVATVPDWHDTPAYAVYAAQTCDNVAVLIVVKSHTVKRNELNHNLLSHLNSEMCHIAFLFV